MKRKKDFYFIFILSSDRDRARERENIAVLSIKVDYIVTQAEVN